MHVGSDAYPLVHPSHPSVVELEQRGNHQRCLVLCGCCWAHLSIPAGAFAAICQSLEKERKIVIILPFLPFLLPLCPPPTVFQLPGGSGVGVGLGIVLYQTVYVRKE